MKTNHPKSLRLKIIILNCSIILGEINTNTTQFLLPNAHIDSIVVPSGGGTGIIKFSDGKDDSHIIPLLTPRYRKGDKP